MKLIKYIGISLALLCLVCIFGSENIVALSTIGLVVIAFEGLGSWRKQNEYKINKEIVSRLLLLKDNLILFYHRTSKEDGKIKKFEKKHGCKLSGPNKNIVGYFLKHGKQVEHQLKKLNREIQIYEFATKTKKFSLHFSKLKKEIDAWSNETASFKTSNQDIDYEKLNSANKKASLAIELFLASVKP